MAGKIKQNQNTNTQFTRWKTQSVSHNADNWAKNWVVKTNCLIFIERS